MRHGNLRAGAGDFERLTPPEDVTEPQSSGRPSRPQVQGSLVHVPQRPQLVERLGVHRLALARLLLVLALVLDPGEEARAEPGDARPRLAQN